MNRLRHTVERFRQPEDTGMNRCLPCMAVNAALAVVFAAVVGVGWRPAGGLLVLGVSVDCGSCGARVFSGSYR